MKLVNRLDYSHGYKAVLYFIKWGEIGYNVQSKIIAMAMCMPTRESVPDCILFLCVVFVIPATWRRLVNNMGLIEQQSTPFGER